MLRLPNPFNRTPDPQAEILAEALARYEEGVEIAAILEEHPEEARAWLRPLLATGRILERSFAEEEASYYFEGALKAKVLTAAAPADVIGGDPAALLPAPSRFGRLGAAAASVGVVGVAAMLGVISFGFITAGDAVPGEWNYGFKRATEQAQVRFASGDERINVQISQAQERIEEMQALVRRGDLSQGHIASFTDQLEEIRDLADEEPFDTLQQAKVRNLAEAAEAVLNETEEDLAPAAAEAIDRAQQVAAAVAGGDPTPVGEGPPAADPAAADPTATPDDPAVAGDPTATPDDPAVAGDPTATPDDPVTATPTPAEPEPTAVAGEPDPATDPDEVPVTTGVDEDPIPLGTPEPDPTATPDPEATPTPDPEPEEPSPEDPVDGEPAGEDPN